MISLSPYIDHTLLKPDATASDIVRLCEEAATYSFKAVCVNPCYVPLAAELLQGKDPLVCTVAGFPLGASHPVNKAREAALAVDQGADEVDMVMHLGAFKGGDLKTVANDIAGVRKAIPGKTLKVILETYLLSPAAIRLAVQLCMEEGADFVKTSTGFAAGGATLEAVGIMKEVAGHHLGIKASGGISNTEQALAFIEAGATRIGTSKGLALLG